MTIPNPAGPPAQQPASGVPQYAPAPHAPGAADPAGAHGPQPSATDLRPRGKGLAITSIVLGGLSILLSIGGAIAWIAQLPFIDSAMPGILLMIVAIVLAVIALVRSRPRKWLAVVALGVGILAFFALVARILLLIAADLLR